MLIRGIEGLASFRRITAFFIIFQAVLVILFIGKFHLDSRQTYSFDPEEIISHIQSSEFDSKDPHKIKVNSNSHVYMDSNGVYRSRDDPDVDENTFVDTTHNSDPTENKLAATTEEPTEEGFSEADIDDEDDSEDPTVEELALSLGKDYGGTQIKNNGEKRRNFVEEMTNVTVISKGAYKELAREQYLVQFSGVGKMTKQISEKVRNPKNRFVSDRRILFSEVYEQVDATEDVELLLIVSSSAKKRSRRDAIRSTWWEECPQNKQVRCFFFTDDFNLKKLSDIKNDLLHESRTYKDMVFQPIDTGVKFGYRFLYQFQWAVAHYRFQYILRVDDDILLCLHRLLHDLKYMRKTSLQWGFLHCESDEAVFMDEGITMLTRDLVLKFLSQNPFRMRCHVFGDQEIAIWIQDLNLDPLNIYVHDSRIHHTPPGSRMREYFTELDDICLNHIAVHGVYPEEMDDFWAKKRSKKYDPYTVEDSTEYCEKELSYAWNVFKPEFKFQPKFCYKKPEWKNIITQLQDGQFVGRENRPDKDELWEKMKHV